MASFLTPFKRILVMVMFDSVVLSALTWLIVAGKLPVLTTSLILYPLMLLSNFWFIRKNALRPSGPQVAPNKKVKIPILGALLYTAACIGAMIYWVSQPDVFSTVQVTIGLLLASYTWYLVFVLRKLNEQQSVRE